MYDYIGTAEKYKRPNLFSTDDELKIKEIEDDGFAIIDESLIVDKEKDFKVATGIIYALIISIPFWLLCILIALWLI